MTGEKRECVCPRTRHRHGDWHAYAADDCRCQPCTAAWCSYYRDLRKRRHLYRGALLIDGTGVARRLQALAVNGWGCPDIARELGVTKFVVEEWRRGGARVHVATHARIAALYDRVWDKPGPGRYGVKVRRLAAEAGWVPPMAWNDEDLDDPNASHSMPQTGAWDLTPCGTPAAARRHYRRREPLCDACRNASKRQSVETRARKVAA